MPHQWLYNPIIEISTIGYIIEMLGNIIKMLKYLPQSQLGVRPICRHNNRNNRLISELGIMLECDENFRIL